MQYFGRKAPKNINKFDHIFIQYKNPKLGRSCQPRSGSSIPVISADFLMLPGSIHFRKDERCLNQVFMVT